LIFWIRPKKESAKYRSFTERTTISGGFEIRDFTKNFSEWTVIMNVKEKTSNMKSNRLIPLLKQFIKDNSIALFRKVD